MLHHVGMSVDDQGGDAAHGEGGVLEPVEEAESPDIEPVVGRASLGSLDSEFDPVEIRSRRRMWILMVAVGIVIGIVTIIFVIRVLPKIFDAFDDIGDELKKQRHSLSRIVGCALISSILNVGPVPFKAAWNLVVCFVYGWGGFPLILFGHCIGGLAAFFGARLLWPFVEARFLKTCCCCMHNRRGRLRRPCRFLLACVEEIETKPMQTVFLLTISPVPVSLIAYTIGAKCKRTTWWEFYIPVTLAGLKLLVPTYVGVSAEDLQSLVTGSERDPVETAFTVGTSIVLIVVLACISRLALRRLKKRH